MGVVRRAWAASRMGANTSPSFLMLLRLPLAAVVTEGEGLDEEGEEGTSQTERSRDPSDLRRHLPKGESSALREARLGRGTLRMRVSIIVVVVGDGGFVVVEGVVELVVMFVTVGVCACEWTSRRT